jgi:hypothetical protein
MFKGVITITLLGCVTFGLSAAKVMPARAQITFDPKASQTTFFALDQGCVGRLSPDFAYFCTRFDYNTGPYSSNFHFTGLGGTVITYVVEPTPVEPAGPSPLQAIIMRDKTDGKSLMLTDLSGSCEVRAEQDAEYLLVRCLAQKGDILIENMGRFYK